jgi:hypothetical protein
MEPTTKEQMEQALPGEEYCKLLFIHIQPKLGALQAIKELPTEEKITRVT